MNDTMIERCLIERPDKMGPLGTRPLPLAIFQCCMHWPWMKCVWVQACPCRATNQYFMGGCPLVECRNKGPTWTPPLGKRPRNTTSPIIITNSNQNIAKAKNEALILCQATPQVVFCLEDPLFSPSILTNRAGWTALPDRYGASHTSHALTEVYPPTPPYQLPLVAAK